MIHFACHSPKSVTGFITGGMQSLFSTTGLNASRPNLATSAPQVLHSAPHSQHHSSHIQFNFEFPSEDKLAIIERDALKEFEDLGEICDFSLSDIPYVNSGAVSDILDFTPISSVEPVPWDQGSCPDRQHRD